MKKFLFLFFTFFSFSFLFSNEFYITKIQKINNKINKEDAEKIVYRVLEEIDKKNLLIEGFDTKQVVFALIEQESTFNINAIEKRTKCMGLFQLSRLTYKEMLKKELIYYDNWKDIKNIDYNISVGIEWLKYTYNFMRKKYRKEKKENILKYTLEAYNKGIYKTIEIIKNKEKFSYSEKVFNKMNKWKYNTQGD